MRCLVTGVAGFIGSHLAERLLADGHEVWGIDNFAAYYPRWMKERNLVGPRSWNTFTFVEGDILTLPLSSLLEGVDWLFHLAAQAGVRASWGSDFARYVDCNVLATQRLLDAVQQGKMPARFVYASSSSVYGDTHLLPSDEGLVPQPVSPYGVTKLAAEQLCQLYYRHFSVPIVALRYFTVYGPRQRPDMAFHRFCKAVLSHQPLPIFGSGEQTRDFTYVSDIVEASIGAATSPQAVGRIFNIAGGTAVSLLEVLTLLQEISGNKISTTYTDCQRGDANHTRANTTLAEQLLDYHPQVALRQGLVSEFLDIIELYQHVSPSLI